MDDIEGINATIWLYECEHHKQLSLNGLKWCPECEGFMARNKVGGLIVEVVEDGSLIVQGDGAISFNYRLRMEDAP